ncbi:hypothetical protein [Azospirillum argentinense]
MGGQGHASPSRAAAARRGAVSRRSLAAIDDRLHGCAHRGTARTGRSAALWTARPQRARSARARREANTIILQRQRKTCRSMIPLESGGFHSGNSSKGCRRAGCRPPSDVRRGETRTTGSLTL